MPFIPMRRMNLWHPITKRKEIIMWIWVYPVENRTLILGILKRVVFLMKPKPLYHLSQWGEWCLITKRKEIIMWIHVYPIGKVTLILKMVEREVFFWNQRLNVIYPNEENVLMVLNQERKGDYYVNQCLSKLMNWH